MRIGTRSLIFGLHSFFVHPILMLAIFKKVVGRRADFVEIVCILIHDIGYFGKPNMDGVEGNLHPYAGAKLARFLFGDRGWRLCVGHNDEVREVEGLPRSVIYAVDKYFYVVIPVWLQKALGIMSGEYKEISLREEGGVWNPAAFKQFMAIRFDTGIALDNGVICRVKL